MLGAIVGDIAGSAYEFEPTKSKAFPIFGKACFFTDDTVLTVAVAAALLDDRDYLGSVLKWGRKYPTAGYGMYFLKWLRSEEPLPYESWGNGSAMRVSPVGFAFDTIEDVMEEAERSAVISHNHPEGIKGAQAVALSIFLARTTQDKSRIREEVTRRFGYDLDREIADIRPEYEFDESCQGSVPEAILAFLESNSYEDAIRTAVSLGGDSDTQACIAGSIAEAFYGEVPKALADTARSKLTPDLLEVVDRFQEKFTVGRS